MGKIGHRSEKVSPDHRVSNCKYLSFVQKIFITSHSIMICGDLFLIAVSVACGQEVQFAPKSILPNENKAQISDSSRETCVTFNATTAQGGPWYTMLRVPMTGEMDFVVIRGLNLGCDQPDIKMYVSTSFEFGIWTGVWEGCSYFDLLPGTPETCVYRCACGSDCSWLQIVRRPLSMTSPAWTLCHVSKYLG